MKPPEGGNKDDPLYKHRRALLTRTDYLTKRQKQRLDLLWDTDGKFIARHAATACGRCSSLAGRTSHRTRCGTPAR
ncbi:hypothetical protein [Timonella senegalensis]|uniref:hypothetical protein n=1 Tax=Timonella senegalensis TaxID=1465825 RepID=UPI0028A68BE8|nr:hypothetical protein [Timonella senegalensis]